MGSSPSIRPSFRWGRASLSRGTGGPSRGTRGDRSMGTGSISALIPTPKRCASGAGLFRSTSSRTNAKSLLAARGLRPKKRLGQHFLMDGGIAARIAALAVGHPGERILEIGAGTGTLTQALLALGAAVTAFDVDAAARDVERTCAPAPTHRRDDSTRRRRSFDGAPRYPRIRKPHDRRFADDAHYTRIRRRARTFFPASERRLGGRRPRSIGAPPRYGARLRAPATGRPSSVRVPPKNARKFLEPGARNPARTDGPRAAFAEPRSGHPWRRPRPCIVRRSLRRVGALRLFPSGRRFWRRSASSSCSSSATAWGWRSHTRIRVPS